MGSYVFHSQTNGFFMALLAIAGTGYGIIGILVIIVLVLVVMRLL